MQSQLRSCLQAEPIQPRFNLYDLKLSLAIGMLGGVGMGISSMLIAEWLEFYNWISLAGVSRIRGISPNDLTFGTILGEVLIHFGVAIGFGYIFVLLYQKIFQRALTKILIPVTSGIMYGLMIWIISSTLIAEVTLLSRESIMISIVQHIVYGGTIGLTYGLIRLARPYISE